MNKQGFIKTVEAIIAVLIIFIFIYYVTPKSSDNQDTSDIKKLQEEILKGISENEAFRECIVKENRIKIIQYEEQKITGFETCADGISTTMQTFIEQSLTQKFQTNYKLVICTPGSCDSPPEEQDTVYTSAVIITSSLKTPPTYNPKVVRLYLW